MIQHVTREVLPRQTAETVDFYGQLGFQQVPTPATLDPDIVWMQLGPTQIHLMPRDDARAQGGHVAVVLGQGYDETLSRLRALGHSVEPRQEHWGSPRAYVRDPAGNLVEVMARPPDTHIES
jgi:catechol 2,3-dioxygenase-like lactoylglutathione lyase family enzyme